MTRSFGIQAFFRVFNGVAWVVPVFAGLELFHQFKSSLTPELEAATLQAQNVQKSGSVHNELSRHPWKNLAVVVHAVTDTEATTVRAAGPGGCYNEAYRFLTREEALDLCSSDSDLKAVRCFTQAAEVMPTELAIRLCKHRGSELSVACFKQAREVLPLEQSMALCSRGGERGTQNRFECYRNATVRLSVNEALEHCSTH